jgi:hypothetical protein
MPHYSKKENQNQSQTQTQESRLMPLLKITEADRKMALSSAMVGAGAVTSISVSNWVKKQSWTPGFIAKNIELATGLAGIPVYALGRKQKGTIKDLVQALGAGMVAGSVYRYLLGNVAVRDFLGLSLYSDAAGTARLENKALELEEWKTETQTQAFAPALGAYTSGGMNPVQGALGSYQPNNSRNFSR